jgi:hypothetical protein
MNKTVLRMKIGIGRNKIRKGEVSPFLIIK